MSNYEFIGMALVIGVPLISGVIAIIKPVFNMAQTITKILVSVDSIKDTYAEVKSELTHHESMLNDHETRLTVVESKI